MIFYMVKILSYFIFGVTSISCSSGIDFFKFFIASPIPLPISGSLDAPKRTTKITNTIINSVTTIENFILQ